MKNEQLFPRKAGKHYQYESIYPGHPYTFGVYRPYAMITLFSVLAIMT